MPQPSELAAVIKLIETVAAEYGMDYDTYFVGGYPRALAMGLGLEDVHDLDIASGSPKRATELAGFVASEGKADDIRRYTRTPTVNVTIGDVDIDFQGPMDHEKAAPYVRLWGVPETAIAKNIFDRDFTIDALAIKIGTSEILDYTRRGMSDINSRKIVAIIPPDVSIPEDPLMITRAVKLACKYEYDIDKALWKAMKKYVNLLPKSLSKERLALEAYVLSKYPESKGMLDELGIDYLEAPEVIKKGKEFSEE